MIATSANATWALWGSTLSPFALKVEALLPADADLDRDGFGHATVGSN